MQALIHRQTGAFIGQCGLLAQEVDGVQELEVGYHIFYKYWGQGYAPEAAKGFLQHAFENKLADSLISIIDVRNLKSQRVAEKNGLVREKQTRWSELDVFVYRISAF
jgi:RimJ/RimL family protein N-acetyltransferase